MKLRYKIILISASAFLVGGYLKNIFIKNPSVSVSEVGSLKGVKSGLNESLISVGDEQITADDLKFEFDLQVIGLDNKSEGLKPSKELADNTPNELMPLEKEILRGIVERKILYKFVEQDRKFNNNLERRKANCLIEWKQTISESLHPDLKKEIYQQKLKSRLCEHSIINQYADENIYKNIQISKEEIKEYFKTHQEQFRYPKRVLIRQVVLASENDAKKVRYKTKRSNIAQLAREHSITPEAEDGGIIGPFAKGQMPPVFDIAFRMRVGDISNVQKSTYGFHIIMLVKKFKKTELSLAQASPEIKSILLRKKQSEEYKKWIDTALHTIKVNTPTPLW